MHDSTMIVQPFTINFGNWKCFSPGVAFFFTFMPKAATMPPEDALSETSTERSVLELENVEVRYPRAPRPTLQGIHLQIPRGSRMAVVGESGCGKTTLMRTLLGLLAPSSGTVRWFGENIASLPGEHLAQQRARVQPVFQDPMSSFDPRYDCRQVLEEPLLIHERESPAKRLARCRKILGDVGLPEEVLQTRPRRLSGGQRQRLAIARAMILSPEVLVADEPTAALDLSVQGQVAALLLDLHRMTHFTLVVISHDFPLVSQLCDRAAVLYAGRIVEEGPLEQVFSSPLHPYTRDLIEASTGDLPPASAPLPQPPAESGCPYRSRCRQSQEICLQPPMLRSIGARKAACHLAGQN